MLKIYGNNITIYIFFRRVLKTLNFSIKLSFIVMKIKKILEFLKYFIEEDYNIYFIEKKINNQKNIKFR